MAAGRTVDRSETNLVDADDWVQPGVEKRSRLADALLLKQPNFYEVS